VLNKTDKGVLIKLIDDRLYDLEKLNAPMAQIEYLYVLMDKVDML